MKNVLLIVLGLLIIAVKVVAKATFLLCFALYNGVKAAAKTIKTDGEAAVKASTK